MLNSNISQIHADDKEIAIANKRLNKIFFSSYLLIILNTLSPIIKKYIPDTKCENVSNQEIYLNKLQILTTKGIKEGKIVPFDDEF